MSSFRTLLTRRAVFGAWREQESTATQPPWGLFSHQPGLPINLIHSHTVPDNCIVTANHMNTYFVLNAFDYIVKNLADIPVGRSHLSVEAQARIIFHVP